MYDKTIRVRPYPEEVITDHHHIVVKETDLIASILCGKCGLPNDQHLSWGKMVANLVGGVDTTYCFKLNSHLIPERKIK